MILEIIITAFICASLLAFILYLRSLVQKPIKPSRGIRLVLRIIASGSAPELEGTVKSVRWLIDNGTLPATIEILDSGMDDDTRAVAMALCRDGDICIRRMPDG